MTDQALGRRHGLIVHGGDDVPGLKPAGGRGAAGLDRAHLRAADLSGAEGHRGIRRGDPEGRVLDGAGLDELGHDIAHLVDRDGEADADAPRLARD